MSWCCGRFSPCEHPILGYKVPEETLEWAMISFLSLVILVFSLPQVGIAIHLGALHPNDALQIDATHSSRFLL